MKKISRNNSTKKILIIILALVIGSFIGYRFALAQSGNALKSVVEPGSMTSEASYIIFTDGSTIYARNGTTGEIEFQSTNASYVIQSAINAINASTYGKLHIKSGVYLIDTEIEVQGQMIIEGEIGSILKATSNLSGKSIMRLGSDSAGVILTKIIDLAFDGNFIPNVTGLYLYRANWCLLSGLAISSCTNWGLILEYGIVNTITNSQIWYNGMGSGMTGGVMVGVDGPLMWTDANANIFIGCEISDNNGVGMRFGSGSVNTVESCTIEGNNYHGIWVQKFPNASGYPEEVLIKNCWFEDNNHNNNPGIPGEYPGIEDIRIGDTCGYCSVEDSHFSGFNEDYCMLVWGSAWHFHLSGGRSYSFPARIDVPSQYLEVEKNGIWVAESSGNTTVSNNDWIAHGLATTPSVVTLTPRSNATVWVNDRNATHFQVGVLSGTVTVDWHAEV